MSRRRCSRARLRPRRRMTRSSPSPSILPSRGSPPSTCSPARRKTRAGAGAGAGPVAEAVAGRASAATRRPPRTPRTPSFRCPRGSTPARPPTSSTSPSRPYGGSPVARPLPGHGPQQTPCHLARLLRRRLGRAVATLPPVPHPPAPPWRARAPDFVSTADNLKTLLQLPWTNRPVRLAVHRLGNTLLLDDVVVDPTSSTHDSFRAPRADTNGGELPREVAPRRLASRDPPAERRQSRSRRSRLARPRAITPPPSQPPPLPPTRTLPRRRHASSPARRTRFSRRNSCIIRCRRRLDSTSPDWTTPRTRVATKPTTPRARSSG